MTIRLPDIGLCACPIDSDKAWGMLAESAPEPFESNNMSESSGMQTVPWVSGNRVVIIPNFRTFEQAFFGVYEVPAISFFRTSGHLRKPARLS